MSVAEPQERPWIRTFEIDGVSATDTTYRTPLIELFTPIKGLSFLDLGAADGYEARAVAARGAARVVAVEGKDEAFELARAAQDYLRLEHHEVRKLDVRRIDTYGLGDFDVVLCFGLLYHMENPFNVLKRICRVTRELLLLETHVAPLSMEGLRDLHRGLPTRLHSVELDGIPFEGKIVAHAGDHARTKGSLDSPWTFWLTIESLVKALTRSGFAIEHYFHELDPLCPEPVRRWGGELGFGRWNTKVWIVASPRGGAPDDAGEPVQRILSRTPEPVRVEARARHVARVLGVGRVLRALGLR
jgi:SAM-dependent methyltransferase